MPKSVREGEGLHGGAWQNVFSEQFTEIFEQRGTDECFRELIRLRCV